MIYEIKEIKEKEDIERREMEGRIKEVKDELEDVLRQKQRKLNYNKGMIKELKRENCLLEENN